MEIGEIISEIWNLPHWWDVLIVATIDDALVLARLFLGFISWWYVWLGLGLIITGAKYIIRRYLRRRKSNK